VTVLDALGVTVPDAMNGTEITSGGGPGYGPTTASELADANTIAVFRNRTVGPVSVIFVSLQIVTYLVALVLLVRGGRRRWGRAAVGFAGLVIVALPVVTFLFGLVRYDRLGLTGYTFAVVGAAVVLALLAVPARRLHRAAPLVCLIALNWLVQVVDLVTGGRLQIDTTFGYSPIVAGRFQGIGNLAFALLVGSALVAATAEWERGGGTPRLDRWWAMVAAIFAVTVVVDGWPAFGSDVGGVLACVPAFGLVLIWLGGWRVSARRVIAIVAATGAVLAVFALVDLARPASQRTHLGRFVADLFDGEAGVIVRRKLEANWQVLTSSVFALLVPALVAGFAVLVTRRRGLVAEAQSRAPGLRPCLIAAVVAGVLGFAVNDSGVAIPAMMIAMVVPWLILHLFAAVPDP
jgi:hypothetical protein